MSYATVVVALLGLCGFALVQGETTSAVLEHQWSSGFKMNIRLQLLEKVTGGWTMTLRFTQPAPGLLIWRAKIVSVSNDNKEYELMNMWWNRDLPKCKVFKLALLANKSLQGTPAPTATVEFKRKRGDNTNMNEEACATTPSPTTTTTTTTTTPSPCTTPKQTTKTASLSSSLYGETTSAVLEHQWPWGFKMNIRLQLLDEVKGGWTMTLRFTKPAPGLLIWRTKIVSVSSDEKVYKLENMPWNGDLPKCKVFELAFRANKSLQGTPAPNATVELRRKKGDNTKLNEAACATTPSPTTTTPSPCTTPKPTTKTASPPSLLYGESTSAVLEHQWPWGFKMNIRLQLLEKVTGGWTMTLRFTKPAPGLLIWRAKIVSVSSDNKVYKLENMPWNRDLPKCKVFKLALLANKTLQGTPAPNATVEFSRKKGDNTNLNEAACATTSPPTTTTSP